MLCHMVGLAQCSRSSVSVFSKLLLFISLYSSNLRFRSIGRLVNRRRMIHSSSLWPIVSQNDTTDRWLLQSSKTITFSPQPCFCDCDRYLKDLAS
ncbi:hypothetical protein L596_002622 [Steinernema carpocapsae]|uniref:Uncharacterized protein n=1 Tax=Steinernema carpocapsae TaxID=34508 RepID=A0A4U8UTR8_STECR|nr:hypothetical protein L596_002622 [Steinernema carpocapsae]